MNSAIIAANRRTNPDADSNLKKYLNNVFTFNVIGNCCSVYPK